MEQVLYDKDNNRYRFQLKEEIGSGSSGKVYKAGYENCIKIFKYPRNSNDNRVEILKIISELDLENLYKIKALLYDSIGDIIGYTMSYYPKERIDILTMPTDYTIENMMGLYQVAEILGKRCIRMHDVLPINTILTSKRIIIIDADSYFLENYECLTSNKYLINCLFIDLYKRHLNLNHDILNYTPESINNINNLFQQKNPEIIYKKLSKHKYPIDCIINK